METTNNTKNRETALAVFAAAKTICKLSQKINKLAADEMLIKAFDAELGAIRDNIICINRAIEPMVGTVSMLALAEEAEEELEDEAEKEIA